MSDSPIPSSSTIVLLIDPYKEDREYWAERVSLSSPDYFVLEAETGEGGLAICRWHQVDCVLVEMSFADMSGFEILLRLVPRAKYPEIPVIFLTRVALPPMRDLALKNGAQAFFLKSQISGDVLNEAMHKAMAKVPRTKLNFGERH